MSFLLFTAEPIALNFRTVACPFIDSIDYETLEYRTIDEGRRGVFDWDFVYHRIPLKDIDKAYLPDPYQ